MKLEFEPNVDAFPLIENELFDDSGLVSEFETILKNGIRSAQAGDREHARQLLKKAVEFNSESEDAWMWMASISEYPEELLSTLDRVLAINPNSAKAVEWRSATCSLLAKTFVDRAVDAVKDGSVGVADKAIEKALEYDEKCLAAWLLKASIGPDEESSLACLRTVLNIDPEHAEALAAIAAMRRKHSSSAFEAAKFAAKNGESEKALRSLNEFLTEVPDSVEGWILRSHLSADLDEKLRSLEAALAIDAKNDAARSSYNFLLTTIAPASENADPQIVSVPETVESDNIIEPANADVAADPDDSGVNAADTDSTLPKLDGFDEVPDVHEVVAEGPTGISLSVDVRVCPFCGMDTDLQAIECNRCHSPLTLTDLESLLSQNHADREVVRQAINDLEAEWAERELDSEELVNLTIGHLILGDYDEAFKCLQQASNLEPNNVALSSKLNTLAIRIVEIKHQNEAHDSMPKGKSILVIDDSATVRKLISSKLEKSGHFVTCAVDGLDALEKLDEAIPDLVLLDISMPNMDGYEVCREMRQRPDLAHVPVVMISGKDGFFDKVRGKMAGTTAYITKPFGPETLMKALEAYLLPEKSNIEQN